MKVRNMISSKGNPVANQFIITDIPVRIEGYSLLLDCDVFQSYKSTIAVRDLIGRIFLDKTYWNYSNTTSKYRNQFLSETTKETKAKIASGAYILVNLN